VPGGIARNGEQYFRRLIKPGCASDSCGFVELHVGLVLAPEIRINIASPSGVDTRWMPRLIGEAAWEQSRARTAETGALRRTTTAEDVAEVLVGLITNADMVTGQNVNIGGTHFGR